MRTFPEITDAAAFLLGRKAGVRSMRDAILAMYPTDAVTGSVAAFPDGADGVPVKELTAAITPVQAGSGDPSPENVRPITGRTGCNIVVSPTLNAQDGTTYTVAFGEAGTVYGGTLNAATGLLTIDWITLQFDGSEDWTLFQGRLRFDLALPCNADARQDALCSHYPYAASTVGIPSFSIFTNGLGVYFNNTGYADTEAWTAFLAAQAGAGTPVQVCYPLDTPQTAQIAPTQIVTLLGQNNVWADTGDVSVTYRADVELYIEKKIGEGT